MKARREKSPRLAVLPVTAQLATLREWMALAEQVYAQAGLALGQVATTAHDEALYLFLRTLDWPLDSDPAVLDQPLTPPQRIALRTVLQKRAINRTPAAYLTHEAFLGDHAFYVDERVIIPRSYFLEVIPTLPAHLPADVEVRRAVDVCTGSGCLAILLAHQFPRAKVDAIDLSADALAVAAINVKGHRLGRRVTLHRSDVFAKVPKAKYDLILSNPPYEPSAVCDDLPEEFKQEPRLALDGGVDGLDIIRRLLVQARERLAPHGIVVLEVGALQKAMNREFKALRLQWLPTIDGSHCICLIRAERLLAWTP
ncbi:MAG TPA: 50S ribosomal protein L3 N(5)-glutamine methyltransferase [Opitutaceae bacterium]